MRLIATAAILLSLTAGTALADGTARAVLDRHVVAIKAANLDALMADYADNAMVISPAGIVPGQANVSGANIFDGKASIRKLFAVLTNKENNAAIRTMEQTYEFRGADTVLMRWTQFKGTAKEAHGTDVWVIRNNKVISQVLLVDPPKK